MARNAAVTVEGLNKLVRRLNTIDKQLTAGLKEAHRKIANVVVAAARPPAPARSGRLAATIRAGTAARQSIVRAGSNGVPYAGPIHWGWPARGIAAHPWIHDAAKRTEPSWLDDYFKELQRLVEVSSA